MEKCGLKIPLNNIQEVLRYVDNGGRLRFNIIDFKKSNKLTLNVETENNFFQKYIEIDGVQDNKNINTNNWYILIPIILILLIIIFFYIKNRRIEAIKNNTSSKLNDIKRIAYIETLSRKSFQYYKRVNFNRKK